MKDASTLERLTLILRDVFDNDDLVAEPALAANQVDGWDSLGNIWLFLEVERVFSVRFSGTEMSSLRDVGELADLIEKKARGS